jgi:hypothetical protein
MRFSPVVSAISPSFLLFELWIYPRDAGDIAALYYAWDTNRPLGPLPITIGETHCFSTPEKRQDKDKGQKAETWGARFRLT